MTPADLSTPPVIRACLEQAAVLQICAGMEILGLDHPRERRIRRRQQGLEKLKLLYPTRETRIRMTPYWRRRRSQTTPLRRTKSCMVISYLDIEEMQFTEEMARIWPREELDAMEVELIV